MAQARKSSSDSPVSPALRGEARFPVITLTTDFGLEDCYVAEMKAVLLRRVPGAVMVDVTHAIPPQDVLAASMVLHRALVAFAPGTVHLAVIDPGVGSARRALAVEISRQWIVCPDNGLITWAWRRQGAGGAREITWRPQNASAVFHGRDLFAPVAARLACGDDPDEFSRAIDDPIFLNVSPAKSPLTLGKVIHIDHFGNAATNVPGDLLAAYARKRIRVKGYDLGRVQRTYCDVPEGRAVALINSSDLLEIAIRNGSAAREMKLKVGDSVAFI